MAKRKRNNMTCPECNGRKKMLNEKNIADCDLCHGTGIFSDEDTEEKFLGRYDFNG